MAKPWGNAGWLCLILGCHGSAVPDAMSVAAAGRSAPRVDAGMPTPAGRAAAVGGSGPRAAAGGVVADAGVDAAASEDAGPAPVPPSASVTKVPETSDEVFRDDVLRTYSLTFTSADWDTLQKTALDEQYVPAQLAIDGQPFGKIGVRYKGSYSLQQCFMNGKQTCRKASMKLKFDAYDTNLRYHGLKRINLHSSLLDSSHLHERLSYQLFRAFGLLAPRSVHARLEIGGRYVGLYNLTEEVDGRFLAHRFEGSEADGTLYKEVWPGTSRDPAYFSKAQETNEGAPVTQIVAFADELAAAKSSTLGQVVTRYMDPDYTLRYLAVHTAIKHWDGPLTFYCKVDSGCANHNFFLYESPSGGRFSIVAWDMDNTFYDDTLTDMAKVPAWYEPKDACIRDGSREFLAPACDRLVQGFNQLGHDAFRAALARLLSGPYQTAPLQADVDRWAKQIDESVETDPAGSGYEDWKANVAGLRAAIGTFRDRARSLRDDPDL